MNRQIGVLSGIAIFLIVLNHAITMSFNPPTGLGIPPLAEWETIFLSILQSLGVFAVPIYLFISGSFIAYAARGEPPQLPLKFLGTSVRHILLPYVFWSLIFYLVIYFHHNQSYSLFGYLKNLLVGYPFHFIPLLLFFYLLSPLLVRIAYAHPGLFILVIGVYQLFLLNIVHPGILGFSLPGWSQYLSPPVLANPLSQWALFFPLGLVYGLHAKTLHPLLERFRWVLILIVIVFYILGVLDGIFQIIELPVARYLSTVAFIMLVPLIRRDKIPFVRKLEKIGRRSYGIYLTHLIMMDLSLIIIDQFAWRVYSIPLLPPLILLFVGIIIPQGLMELVSRSPLKRSYRVLFG